MEKLSLLLVSVLSLSLFPLGSNAQEPADYSFVNMVDSVTKPYTFEHLQTRFPQGYVCGYVVNDTWGNGLYSIFLNKNKRKYELVLNVADKTEVRKIDGKLARQLEESVRNRLADAQKELEKRQETNTGFVTVSYDESYIKFYVMIPTQIAEYWSWETLMIPDRVWREEYSKFSIALPEVKNELTEPDEDEVIMVVEESPEFPGGTQAFRDYLRDNIKYPEACRKDSRDNRNC